MGVKAKLHFTCRACTLVPLQRCKFGVGGGSVVPLLV